MAFIPRGGRVTHVGFVSSFTLIMFTCRSILVGLCGCVALAIAAGCGSEPQPAINMPVPAASLRIVNLTDEPLTYRVNQLPPIELAAMKDGRFENVRPDREAIVAFPELGQERRVTIASDKAVTFFVYPEEGGTEIMLVEDEPKTGVSSAVLVRVVSLLGRPNMAIQVGDATVDAGGPSEPISLAKGPARILAGSSSMEHEFDLGQAFTLVVFGDPNQPLMKLMRNNPESMATFSPAGAATP